MTTVTDVEKALLDTVSNDVLRLCLYNFRYSVEGLWRPGTIRIVDGYTDHGIEHYQRIARYLLHLLSAKSAQALPLNDEEMFLLIGGIYLHDIGMQCDVRTEDGGHIKSGAEKLGAKFGRVQFKASIAGDYSKPKQNAIRANHQYLSASWIRYAHQTGNTVLGSAARQIPHQLIQDLIDVCLYHTGLRLRDVSFTLAGGGAGRKLLVATLLRFADELDIGSDRVDMAAVTQFRRDPANAVYWWLHHLSQVAFPSSGVFRLTVNLNEADYAECAPAVRSFYFDRFQIKNQEVLQLLGNLGFPVTMDAYSAVNRLADATSLPKDVKETLNLLTKKSSTVGPVTKFGQGGTRQPFQETTGAIAPLVAVDQTLVFSAEEARRQRIIMGASGPVATANGNVAITYLSTPIPQSPILPQMTTNQNQNTLNNSSSVVNNCSTSPILVPPPEGGPG